MKKYDEAFFKGDRQLFQAHDFEMTDSEFGIGQSPLKEVENVKLDNVTFKFKYPLWYAKHVKVDRSFFEDMSRSGIWYTDDIEINDSSLQAPKLFRRSQNIRLNRDHFSDADQTLWMCKNIEMNHVQARGDYFGMNSENIKADHLDLIGNYCFDGAKNIEIHNSNLMSKDAFWNCENVTIYDSKLDGEYLAWNSKNITLVNCVIEGTQPLVYDDNVKLVNCKMIQADYAFEHSSNIDADIKSKVISIFNPLSGKINVESIDRFILNDPKVDKEKIIVTAAGKKVESVADDGENDEKDE